jgi:hypothetical protein
MGTNPSVAKDGTPLAELMSPMVVDVDPVARRPRPIPQNETRRPQSSAARGAVPPTDKKHG